MSLGLLAEGQGAGAPRPALSSRLTAHRAVVETRTNISMGWLIAQMALYVIVGTPMVAYLWETMNDLLQLQADRNQLLIAIPVLLAFAGWLVLLARWTRHWTASSVH